MNLSKSETNHIKEFDTLVNLLNKHFDAKYLKPRVVSLTDEEFYNDSEVEKLDELEDYETIELTSHERIGIARLIPSDDVKDLVAIDTASVRLGETERGIITAVRSVIVVKTEGEYRFLKFGPYIVHITEQNKYEIYDYIKKYFDVSLGEPPKLNKMQDRFRNFIERISQKLATNLIQNGIVLLDGSLTAGTVDTPKKVLEEILHSAAENNNSVVGVSKNSWLKLSDGTRILTLLADRQYSCLADVDKHIMGNTQRRILGHVFVVKFTPDGFTFRVDVFPSKLSQAVKILRTIKSSCIFYNGYPDILRHAHINAYFTANEILGMQNYAIDNFNLILVRSFDVKKHLLAPFR